MIGIKGSGFSAIVFCQMVIEIWKCNYESGFGNVVKQMFIGFWKFDHESWKVGY